MAGRFFLHVREFPHGFPGTSQKDRGSCPPPSGSARGKIPRHLAVLTARSQARRPLRSITGLIAAVCLMKDQRRYFCRPGIASGGQIFWLAGATM